MSEHSVTYGNRTISYSLERRLRESLEISVHPDKSVEVVAPLDVTMEEIQQKMKKRASWIVKQQHYFENFLPRQPPRKYVSGETHTYLGRQYRLKVVQDEIDSAKLIGKFLIIRTKKRDDPDHIKNLLYSWYRSHAGERFDIAVHSCLDVLEKHGVHEPIVQIKAMKKRWGSCVHNKGKIILNIELVKAPSHCIQYIVMHEMCHLKYPFHDKKFYDFLGLVMPDWKLRKDRLELVNL